MTKLRTFSSDDEAEKILKEIPYREASEFIRNAIKEKSSKIMQCVILCGGLGTRLYPISKDTPKSMVKINNKSFIEYQIDLLKKNDIKDIVLCVGHLADQIKNYLGDGRKFGVKITYGDPKNAKYDTVGVIKSMEERLKKEFFVMYGDSYLPIDFKDVMNKFLILKKKGLMTVFKNFDKFDKSNVKIDHNNVILYDKNARDVNYIDYGLSVLDKTVINHLPHKTKISLGDVFRMLIEKNELGAHEVDKRFYEIGSFQGLKDFEELIKK